MMWKRWQASVVRFGYLGASYRDTVKLDLFLDMSVPTRRERITATSTSASAQFDSACDCDNRHLPHWQTDLERPTPLPQCLAARSNRAHDYERMHRSVVGESRFEQPESSCRRWGRYTASDIEKESRHQTQAFKTIMASQTYRHSLFRYPTVSHPQT
jgi:hypothetical protein